MVTVRNVEYEAEGVVMNGRLAVPDGDGVCPGVLLCHEGPGLDDFQRERTRTYAEQGYVAFALDYHGGGRVIATHEKMLAALDVLSNDLGHLRALGNAGLDVLVNEPRTDATKLAAVGYCYGGQLALEMARGGADLKAVVGFHPGLGTTRPEDARNIVGKVLMCVGADDPFIPLETRLAFEDEMRAGGVDWRLIVFGGVGHSFTHPWVDAIEMPGLQYDEVADRRSWRAMIDLFDEVFA